MPDDSSDINEAKRAYDKQRAYGKPGEPPQQKEQEDASRKEVLEDIIETEELEESKTKTEKIDDSSDKEDWESKYNELNNKYLMVYADFENSKKRLEKDKYSAISYAIENFSKDILTVMDNLLLALKSTENSEADSEKLLKTLKEGIDLTAKTLEKTLNKYDIQAIDTSGEFDPTVHNAISKVKSEAHNSGDIVEVFQMGYTLKDKVIREAMVSIAE